MTDFGYWTIVTNFGFWTIVTDFGYLTRMADFGFWISDTTGRFSMLLAPFPEVERWWPIMDFGRWWLIWNFCTPVPDFGF